MATLKQVKATAEMIGRDWWDEIECTSSLGSDRRVSTALALAMARFTVAVRPLVARKIVCLHDHKGTLYVICRPGLNNTEREAFNAAWEELNEYEVEFMPVANVEDSTRVTYSERVYAFLSQRDEPASSRELSRFPLRSLPLNTREAIVEAMVRDGVLEKTIRTNGNATESAYYSISKGN